MRKLAKKTNKNKNQEDEVPKKNETAEAESSNELEEARDLLMRTAAEFDNYKRRSEKERILIGEHAKATVLKALLPIVDNIERSADTDPASPEYAKGIEMITKQFADIMGALGLKKIGEIGETFDPNMHEAVMHIEDDSVDANTVVQILQKGYMFGDTVVRHAMVKVAN